MNAVAAVVLAAARASDAIVLVTVAVGAGMAVTGLASFDPRLRGRLPIGVLASGNALMSVGLVVAGLLLTAIALGFGE